MEAKFTEVDGSVTLTLRPQNESDRVLCVLFEERNREKGALYNVEFNYDGGNSNG